MKKIFTILEEEKGEESKAKIARKSVVNMVVCCSLIFFFVRKQDVATNVTGVASTF